MKTFTRLTVLILLIVPSAISQDFSDFTATTTNPLTMTAFTTPTDPTTTPPTMTTSTTPTDPTTTPPTMTTSTTLTDPTTTPPTMTASTTLTDPTTTPPTMTASTTPTTTTTTPTTTTAPTIPTTTTTTPTTTTAPTTPTTTTTTPTTTTAPTTPTTTTTTPTTTIAPTTPTTTTTTPTTTIAPTTPTTTTTTPTTTIAPTTPTTTTTTPTTTTAPTIPTTTTTTPTTTIAPTTTTTTPKTTVNIPGTIPSVTSSNVTSPKPSSSKPNATDLCQAGSCGGDSSCVDLYQSHFCLCMNGYYYQSSKCNKGKVFPGTIKIKVSEASALEDKMSKAYEVLHTEIITFFHVAFVNYLTYGQTVIHKVGRSASARSEMRAGDQVVDVAVVNLFEETTKENEMTINAAIRKAISNNPSMITDYIMQDRCEFYGCVKKNEQDDCSDGLQCKCKDGLERPNPQTAFCLDPQCPDTCSAAHNMQCFVKAGVGAECVCLPGYQKDEHGHCQACAFGYSGVNCEDQFQLILTIVGTIAGILILALVIALIFTRSKKIKDIEEENLIENDFQNLRLQQTTGFNNSIAAEGSIFPKVRMVTLKDSQLQNPYVIQKGMPRPDY